MTRLVKLSFNASTRRKRRKTPHEAAPSSYRNADNAHQWRVRRRFKGTVPGILLIIISILSAILCLLSVTRVISGDSRALDVSGIRERRRHETYFLKSWSDYVAAHPVRARDRSGFAEMGLRTQMYVHLLQNPSLGELDVFERSIWPFAPGIRDIRRQHVKNSRTQSKKAPHNSSRGIVLTAGKGNWLFAIHLIATIRRVHRSDIPIEVYYYGREDLPYPHQAILEGHFINVRVIDLSLSPIFDEKHARLSGQGYALKPFAMLASNFSEVILADADAVFLLDPSKFFDDIGYQETGTLFFHDREHQREGAGTIIHEFMKDQLADRGPSDYLSKTRFWTKKGIYQQESGVVVMDKRRISVFAALVFTAWQNIGDIRDKTTYRVFWGDKESFWLAFELAQLPYHFQMTYAGIIGNEKEGRDMGFCAEHPLHMLGNCSTMECRPSWFNGSLLQDKGKSRTAFLKASAWSTDGDWEFIAKSEAWCMRNYTRRSIEESGLSTRLRQLINIAQEAEAAALQSLMHRS